MAIHERTWADLGFLEETRAKNLIALTKSQPDLASHLGDVGIHENLTIRETKGEFLVHRRFHRALYRVEELLSECESKVAPQQLRDAGALMFFGVGTGERAFRFLQGLSSTQNVIFFESDPSLLTLALSRFDFSPWIDSHQAQFLLGAELWATPLPAISQVTFHPLMGDLHLWERLHLESRWTSGDIDSDKKLMSARQTVVVLDGELLVSECAHYFHQIHFDVFRLDASMLTPKQIARELALIEPKFTFSINFSPELGAIAGRLGFPYLAWEIDPTASTIPTLLPMDRSKTASHVFTWRRKRMQSFARAKYRNIHFLPIAADPSLRSPAVEKVKSPVALAFVGSCMKRQGRKHRSILEELAKPGRNAASDWQRFLEALDQMESRVQQDPCQEDIEDQIRAALDSYGLPDVIELPEGQADVIVLAGESLASSKRIAIVQGLVELGMSVFGEEEWRDAVPGLDYRGPLGHGRALSNHYASTAINIDINRLYQPDIVTLRTFEVAACGGFLLTEANTEIAGLFNIGHEIIVYRNLDDLREKILYYQDRPQERAKIAASFHKRFMEDHRLDQRLVEMMRLGLSPS